MIRCLRRVPCGPALPVTRRERCCHWTLSRVKEQSSETRSPVSSRVQTISFSSGLRQALASRSASSARRGSRTNWCAISSPAWQRGRFAVGRRSRTRFALSKAGYQAAQGDNSGSRPCFRPTWPTRSGRWKSRRVRVITQKANSLSPSWRKGGQRSIVHFLANRCHTPRKPSPSPGLSQSLGIPSTDTRQVRWFSAAPPSPGVHTMRVVGIHGIGQTFKGAAQLKPEWLAAINAGLEEVKGIKLGDGDFAMVGFGPVFRPDVTRSGDSAIDLDDVDPDEIDADEQAVLVAWWEEAARLAAAAPKPGNDPERDEEPTIQGNEEDTRVRVPALVQRALRQLTKSRFFSEVSAQNVLLFGLRQVRQFLHDPDIKAKVLARV